jgi:hypothetical protein
VNPAGTLEATTIILPEDKLVFAVLVLGVNAVDVLFTKDI